MKLRHVVRRIERWLLGFALLGIAWIAYQALALAIMEWGTH